MNYTPQVWRPGTPAQGGTPPSSGRMNHIERGIADAYALIDGAGVGQGGAVQVIGDRSKGSIYGSQISNPDTQTSEASRIGVVMLAAAHDLTLRYANAQGGNGLEADGTSPYTVWCAIEDTDGTVIPLTDPSGATVGVNQTVDFTIRGDWGEGDILHVRSQVRVAAGGTFPRPVIPMKSGEGSYAPSADNDIATAATSSFVQQASNPAFGPAGIFGISPTSLGSVLVVGTSISAGAAATDLPTEQAAWTTRGIQHFKISTHLLALPSAAVYTWATLRQRWRRMATTRGVTFSDCIVEHATNDLGGNRTLAQLQADSITAWQQMGLVAGRVWSNTCMPICNLSGGVTTPQNATWETRREQWNAWLRDGAPMVGGVPVDVGASGARCSVYGPTGAKVSSASGGAHLLAGVWDPSAVIESTTTPGTWADPTDTADGVHPTTQGHIKIAACVPGAALGWNPQ